MSGAQPSAGAAPAQLYAPAAPPYHTLVQDAAPKAVIVLPREPSHVERYAANELQHYIAKISGAELPIVAEGAAPKGYKIFVGNTRALRGAGVRLNADTAGRDGFAALLIQLTDPYGRPAWREAAVLFERSGQNLEKMTDATVDFILGERDTLEPVAELITEIANLEEQAYELIAGEL